MGGVGKNPKQALSYGNFRCVQRRTPWSQILQL